MFDLCFMLCNLALVGKGPVRFIYTITIYFVFPFQWLILYYVYWWLIWCLPCNNNLHIIKYSTKIMWNHVIFVEYLMIVMVVWQMLLLEILLERSLKKAGWTRWCFFCYFWTIYFCFHFCYFVVCIELYSHTQTGLRYFDSV